MQYLRFFEPDQMFEMLLSADLALHSDLWLVRILGERIYTLSEL